LRQGGYHGAVDHSSFCWQRGGDFESSGERFLGQGRDNRAVLDGSSSWKRSRDRDDLCLRFARECGNDRAVDEAGTCGE